MTDLEELPNEVYVKKGNTRKYPKETGPRRYRKVKWFARMHGRTAAELVKALGHLQAAGCPLDWTEGIDVQQVTVNGTNIKGGRGTFLYCETREEGTVGDKESWEPVQIETALAKSEKRTKRKKQIKKRRNRGATPPDEDGLVETQERRETFGEGVDRWFRENPY